MSFTKEAEREKRGCSGIRITKSLVTKDPELSPLGLLKLEPLGSFTSYATKAGFHSFYTPWLLLPPPPVTIRHTII